LFEFTPQKLRPFIGGSLNRGIWSLSKKSATVGSRASAVAALVHLNHNVLGSQPLVATLRDAGSPLRPASPLLSAERRDAWLPYCPLSHHIVPDERKRSGEHHWSIFLANLTLTALWRNSIRPISQICHARSWNIDGVLAPFGQFVPRAFEHSPHRRRRLRRTWSVIPKEVFEVSADSGFLSH